MSRILRISTCFGLVVIASILISATAGIGTSIRTDDEDENGRLHFSISVRGNRMNDPAKAIDSAGLDAEILSYSDIKNGRFAENATSSPAPSNPPSVSPAPTAKGGHNTTTVSPAPSLSSPPTPAGGVPSAPPSISNPPTTTNHTHPPSVSPVPSAQPTPDNDQKGGSLFQKFVRAVTWTIVALVTALSFGWIVSNHRRILPLLGELWVRIRTTDWLRFAMNMASRTREACSGLYHRLRFGRWSFRGIGGRDYDTVPLNEIVFDPHDSGDPTELLLQRER